jgi:hypothetical protein
MPVRLTELGEGLLSFSHRNTNTTYLIFDSFFAASEACG